jgi:hypothetical protein
MCEWCKQPALGQDAVYSATMDFEDAHRRNARVASDLAMAASVYAQSSLMWAHVVATTIVEF